MHHSTSQTDWLRHYSKCLHGCISAAGTPPSVFVPLETQASLRAWIFVLRWILLRMASQRRVSIDDKNAGASAYFSFICFEGLVALSRGGMSSTILTRSKLSKCALPAWQRFCFSLFFSFRGVPRRLLHRHPLPQRMGDACVVLPGTDSCLLRAVWQQQ